MGDRIAILDQGVLQQVGGPQDVYARPANLFVARFIGNPPMNTITGDVTRVDGSVGVQIPGGVVGLPGRSVLPSSAAGRDTSCSACDPRT